MEPLHKRSNSWEGWPASSLDEVADIACALRDLVDEAGGDPELTIAVNYADKEYRGLSVREFRELAPSMSFEDIQRLWVNAGSRRKRQVEAQLWLFGPDILHPRGKTDLDIQGKQRIAVDGLNVQGQAEVKSWIDGHRPLPPPEEEAASPVDTAPAWRRLLNHQWTVVIVGTLVATVLAGIILALVAH